MTRIVVSYALGEGILNYAFSWRTTSDIIGAFVGCLAKARVDKWAMVRLCQNVFDLVWCVSLEEAIMSLDEKLRTPLPKMYMAHPPGSFDLAIVPRHPLLVIHEQATYNLESEDGR